MNGARVSVYVTSYNQRAELAEAVDSVLAQTRPAHQIIIVDDASTDDSRDLIADYRRQHPGLIEPVLHDQNRGVAAARVSALQAVTGDLVTYVDGDDFYRPTKLAAELAALQRHPDAGIAFCNTAYVDAGGKPLWNWVDQDKPPVGDVFAATYCRDYPRRSLFRMEMVRVDALREVGFHDPTLRLYEDWDLRIRLTKRLRVAYHDEPLAVVRLHGRGLASSPPAEHLAAIERVLGKNLPLLDDLPAAEQQMVHRKIGEWLAQVARSSALDAARRGSVARRLSALPAALKAMRYRMRSRRGAPCVAPIAPESHGVAHG